jgi:hypothetical protein
MRINYKRDERISVPGDNPQCLVRQDYEVGHLVPLRSSARTGLLQASCPLCGHHQRHLYFGKYIIYAAQFISSEKYCETCLFWSSLVETLAETSCCSEGSVCLWCFWDIRHFLLPSLLRNLFRDYMNSLLYYLLIFWGPNWRSEIRRFIRVGITLTYIRTK